MKLKRKLTKRIVDGLKFEGEATNSYFVWDSDIDGFGVRLYKSGKKTYVISYYHNGRKRIMVLGKCSQIALDQAHKLAQKYFSQLAEDLDPADLRKKDKEIPTVSSFADRFIEDYAKPHRKTWKEDHRRIERNIKPNLGSRRLDTVTKSDVLNLHSKIGKTSPVESNRIIELIRRIFAIAIEWEVLPNDFLNPASQIKKYSENKGVRILKQDECERLGDAINAEENIYARSAIILVLLCGTRIGETLKSKWSDFDLEGKKWLIPQTNTKNKKVHELPLTDFAIYLLQNIPHGIDDTVFPIVSIRPFWERIRLRANLPDLKLHDLRRSAASMMVSEGTSLHVVSKILNHKGLSITSDVYAHMTSPLPLQDALESHANNIVTLMNLEDENINEKNKKVG